MDPDLLYVLPVELNFQDADRPVGREGALEGVLLIIELLRASLLLPWWPKGVVVLCLLGQVVVVPRGLAPHFATTRRLLCRAYPVQRLAVVVLFSLVVLHHAHWLGRNVLGADRVGGLVSGLPVLEVVRD